MSDQGPPLKPILIVLPDGFADWETGLIGGAAPEFCGVTVRHATPGGGPVRSIGGLTVRDLPDIVLQGDEVVVLCGSDLWSEPQAPDLTEMLQNAHRRGQTIAGICAATLALGRAGLLDAVDHTSNGLWFVDQHLPGYAGRSLYRDVPHAVADGGVITAPGTAPLTFAALVLRAAGVPDEVVMQMRSVMTAETAS